MKLRNRTGKDIKKEHLCLWVFIRNVAQYVGLIAGSIVNNAKTVVSYSVVILTENQLNANILDRRQRKRRNKVVSMQEK